MSEVLALTGRQMTHLRRTPEKIISVWLTPIAMVVILGYLFARSTPDFPPRVPAVAASQTHSSACAFASKQPSNWSSSDAFDGSRSADPSTMPLVTSRRAWRDPPRSPWPACRGERDRAGRQPSRTLSAAWSQLSLQG